MVSVTSLVTVDFGRAPIFGSVGSGPDGIINNTILRKNFIRLQGSAKGARWINFVREQLVWDRAQS